LTEETRGKEGSYWVVATGDEVEVAVDVEHDEGKFLEEGVEGVYSTRVWMFSW
jgi:hypothetical protein